MTCPQDFYNLVDVYLDAVLHPKCVADKRTFEQEVRALGVRMWCDPGAGDKAPWHARRSVSR